MDYPLAEPCEFSDASQSLLMNSTPHQPGYTYIVLCEGAPRKIRIGRISYYSLRSSVELSGSQKQYSCVHASPSRRNPFALKSMVRIPGAIEVTVPIPNEGWCSCVPILKVYLVGVCADKSLSDTLIGFTQ